MQSPLLLKQSIRVFFVFASRTDGVFGSRAARTYLATVHTVFTLFPQNPTRSGELYLACVQRVGVPPTSSEKRRGCGWGYVCMPYFVEPFLPKKATWNWFFSMCLSMPTSNLLHFVKNDRKRSMLSVLLSRWIYKALDWSRGRYYNNIF